MDARHIGLDPDPYRNAALGIGYRVGDLIVLSGHASLDDDGRFVDGDFAGQAGRALGNLASVITNKAASGGVTMDKDQVIDLIDELARKIERM